MGMPGVDRIFQSRTLNTRLKNFPDEDVRLPKPPLWDRRRKDSSIMSGTGTGALDGGEVLV